MELLVYILKANVLFIVLFAAYSLILRQETHFRTRRAWLLSMAVVAMLLPLLPSPFTSEVVLSYQLPSYVVTSGPISAPSFWDNVPFIALGYLLVVVVLLMRSAFTLSKALRSSADHCTEAFSFFGLIVLPKDLSDEDRAAMLAHEQVHVREGHSVDLLMYEVLAAFNWVNPLWRLAQREVRLVHEFTADAEAQNTHERYDALLVAQAMGVPSHFLLNHFRSSEIKTRTHMLNQPRSPRSSRMKLALAIPALAIGAALISWQAIPTDPPSQQETYKVVEKMPEYPGGKGAMFAYMQKEINYPMKVKKGEQAVEGTVHVGFIVDAKGKVTDVKAIKKVHPELDAEAVRAIKGMPDWIPGEQKGKKVPVEMVLPIKFVMPPAPPAPAAAPAPPSPPAAPSPPSAPAAPKSAY